MRSLLIVFLFSIFFAVSAQAGTLYKWTDDSGTFSFTDDISRVPAKYQAKVVVGEMPAIADYSRFTPVETTASRVQLNARLQQLRSERKEVVRVEKCSGHGTVEQIRSTHTERGNTYNSLFYVLRNACGVVTSVTRSNPRVYIESFE